MKRTLDATITVDGSRWNIFVRTNGEAFIQHLDGDLAIADAIWNGRVLSGVYPPHVPYNVLATMELELRSL